MHVLRETLLATSSLLCLPRDARPSVCRGSSCETRSWTRVRTHSVLRVREFRVARVAHSDDHMLISLPMAKNEKNCGVAHRANDRATNVCATTGANCLSWG